MQSLIWFTDRSRYEEGLARCQRSRLFSYHFGPLGYGIQRKARAIPLATGSYVHEGIAEVLDYVKVHDKLPPDEVTRSACVHAVRAYQKIVKLRGIAVMDQSDRADIIEQEQSYLIEGLIWAFVLTTLPFIHQDCRIVAVEQEETLLVGCTCGLGDMIGDVQDHEARACEGIGFQSRPDFITEYRARPGVYAYWELKTLGQPNEPWESQWETKVQFAAGALGAAKRLEVEISEAYVVGLIKGRREGDTYNPDTRKREGMLRQQSMFCYWYRKPGNPPFEAEDWQPHWNYVGDDGKNHTLGKSYQKAPLWEIPLGKEAAAAGLSVPEFCAKFVGNEVLAKNVLLLGPLNIQKILVNELVEELIAEESRWKETVWALYEALEANAFDWTSQGYQAVLRARVPRSWECRRYGKRHECQFVPLCFEQEGWQDPLGGGNFVARRPHHEGELRQIEQRGLVPEAGWADEEEVD